ncbi:MAG: hypothetical protein HY751_09420 [Nitrospinae bacterium]|nr:hypothetical protein [Nitrospinota bacterium]
MLVIVTKTAEKIPSALGQAVFAQARTVALIQDGVYNTPARLTAHGLKLAAGAEILALADDVAARNITAEARLVSYTELASAIETNDRVITL